MAVGMNICITQESNVIEPGRNWSSAEANSLKAEIPVCPSLIEHSDGSMKPLEILGTRHSQRTAFCHQHT